MLSPEVERRNPLFRFTFKICILNLFRILYFEFLQNNKKKSKKFGRYRNDMFQVGKILRFFGEQNSRFELRAKISILIEKIFKSPIYRRVTFKLSIRRHLKQSSLGRNMMKLNQMTEHVEDIKEEIEMVSPGRKLNEIWKHFTSASSCSILLA